MLILIGRPTYEPSALSGPFAQGAAKRKCYGIYIIEILLLY